MTSSDKMTAQMKNRRPFNIWISPRRIDFSAAARNREPGNRRRRRQVREAIFFHSYTKDAQDESGTRIDSVHPSMVFFRDLGAGRQDLHPPHRAAMPPVLIGRSPYLIKNPHFRTDTGVKNRQTDAGMKGASFGAVVNGSGPLDEDARTG
jgi:hypothetical protein